MISEPMVRSAQTVHLPCVKICTISQWNEMSIHLSHISFNLGTFNPKTENQTEPNRIDILGFFLFSNLASVFDFANFGVWHRLWFLDSRNQTPKATEFIFPACSTALLSIPSSHLGPYRPNPTLQLQPILQTQEPYL
jgi:hypothetical protein